MIKIIFIKIKQHFFPFIACFLIINCFNSLIVKADNKSPHIEEIFQKILQSYTFIDDLERKESERDISKAKFWRYPFRTPIIIFPIDTTLGDKDDEIPASQGHNRPVEHINLGRKYFREGRYTEAKSTWLAARARFGTTFKYHRRNDFFIGLSFLKLAKQLETDKQKVWTPAEVKLTYTNAGFFLSWALLKKADVPDELVEKVSPKAFATLATIYQNYGRYTAAHGVITEGLNFLRRTGRKEYRPQLRRMLAESWMRNGDNLAAIRELDTLIRQDHIPSEAAAAFSRVGDIYFDLNNYELAEDMYSISDQLSKELKIFLPENSILRGESLFWLGEFSLAQKFLWFGIKQLSQKKNKEIHKEYIQWSYLRIADSFLARYHQENNPKEKTTKNDLLEQAKLGYFRVEHNFPGTEVSRIAQIRRGCIEQKEYKSNNILHIRRLMRHVRSSDISYEAIELAWSCQIDTYIKRNEGDEMLELVKEFLNTFPDSQYLDNYLEPVKNARNRLLDKYIDTKSYNKAILFYTLYKEALFTELTTYQKRGLFIAYVETMQSEKAEFFSEANADLPDTDMNLIREAVFLSEIYQQKYNDSNHNDKHNELAKKLNGYEFKLSKSPHIVNYLHRILNSNAAKLHIPWIYKLFKKWSKGYPHEVCSTVYPLLSKWTEIDDSAQIKEYLFTEVQSLINSLFPKIIKKDRECANAILELEMESGKADIIRYAMLWSNRNHWPINKTNVSFIWLASEILYSNERKDLAQKLWEYIVQKVPTNFHEHSLAKLRLNDKKTETEDLWK